MQLSMNRLAAQMASAARFAATLGLALAVCGVVQAQEKKNVQDDTTPKTKVGEKPQPKSDEKGKTDEKAKPAEKSSKTADDGRAQLLEAFEVSKSATSPKQYTQMIDLCEKGIAGTSSAAYKEYGKRLAAWAYYKRGDALAAASPPKEKEAMADFEAALKYLSAYAADERPAWEADLIHNHGVSSAMAGDFDKALADFNRVLDLRPTYGKEYFNRGEIYYARGDWPKAVLDYTQAIRNGYTEAVVYTRRGSTYFKQEDPRRALADYNQAIARNPGDFEAYTLRGDAQAAEGNYAQALRDYIQAIDLNDKYGRVYFSAAWLRATCARPEFRDAELALRSAKKAIQLDGEDYRYLEVLAAAQARAGQFDEAIATEKKALEKIPKELKEEQRIAQARLAMYENKTPYVSEQATPGKPPARQPEGKQPDGKQPEGKTDGKQPATKESKQAEPKQPSP